MLGVAELLYILEVKAEAAANLQAKQPAHAHKHRVALSSRPLALAAAPASLAMRWVFCLRTSSWCMLAIADSWI